MSLPGGKAATGWEKRGVRHIPRGRAGHRVPLYNMKDPTSAATRRKDRVGAAATPMPTTSTRDVRLVRSSNALAARHPAAGVQGYDPNFSLAGSTIPPRRSAPRHVRLCLQGRRRLARHAQTGRAARLPTPHRARPVLAQLRPAVEEEPRRDGVRMPVGSPRCRRIARNPELGKLQSCSSRGAADYPTARISSSSSTGPIGLVQRRLLPAARIRRDL